MNNMQVISRKPNEQQMQFATSFMTNAKNNKRPFSLSVGGNILCFICFFLRLSEERKKINKQRIILPRLVVETGLNDHY